MVAPLLSVIIPTQNRSDKLIKVLDALFTEAATLDDAVELLVVDDGSRASEAEAVEQYLRERDPQARMSQCLRQEARGPAAARNYGLRAARGDVVLFIGDDIVSCGQLLGTHIEAHTDRYLDDYYAILGLADLPPELANTPFARWWRARNFRYGQLLSGRREPDIGFFFTNNLSLKRRFLLEHGVFDEAFPAAAYEDVELGYRLAPHGLKIIFLPQAEAYHVHRIDVETACKRMYTRGRYYDLFRERTDYPAVSRVWMLVGDGPWMQPWLVRPLWRLASSLENRASLGPFNVLILMYFFQAGRGLKPGL